MKILIQTRCGCTRFSDIGLTQAPPNIQIQLQDNKSLGIGSQESYDHPTRRFTYVGTQKGSDIPVYVESLEQEGYEVDQPLATKAEPVEQQHPETD